MNCASKPTFPNCTLESGIVVLVGIIVLVGIFVKINKRIGWNKCTGGNYHQINSTKSKTYFQVITQILILQALSYYISIKILANW